MDDTTMADEGLKLTTMFDGKDTRDPNRQSISRDTCNHSLYNVMTTASTPVTPVPSTPSTARTHPLIDSRFTTHGESPPRIIRPKSTPFPEPDMVEGEIQCPLRLGEPEADLLAMELSESPIRITTSRSPLHDMPTEIHDCILDHLFGVRSAASRVFVPGKSSVLRSWSSALRHSRRKEVTELALVSQEWRRLIQDRLYRHLKIKGTRDAVDQAMLWFADHPHLRAYVKHVEIWFPVFQPKVMTVEEVRRIINMQPTRFPIGPVVLQMLGIHAPPRPRSPPPPTPYQVPTNNCTLEETFGFIRWTFPEVCVLTLEGGERRKPPQIQYFKKSTTNRKYLPQIPRIRTMVIKGQWNLIRQRSDFALLMQALPNLNEWHGSYAKPKSKAYLSIASIMPHLPANLTHVNLCLEGDFKRESVSPLFWRKVTANTHFCVDLAKAMPALEHLSYTGRVCGCFFDEAARLSNARTTRLKSLELVVKNVCRPVGGAWNDGTGIMDLGFIEAFERLVTAGMRSLRKLKALEYMRIRFIDLESAMPPLNPYFMLANNQCTGIWSESIRRELTNARPGACLLEEAPDVAELGYQNGTINGEKWPRKKPLSIKTSSYKTISGGVAVE